MKDYRITINPARTRIYMTLVSYITDESAAARAIEIENTLRKAEKPSVEMVKEILGRLDHHDRVPDEIRDYVADLVIQAWTVVHI